MRTFLIILVLVAAAAGVWYLFGRKEKGPEEPKPQPVAVSRHSDAFNGSVEDFMNSYYALSESFVNWDSAGVNRHSAEMDSRFDSIRFEELRKDTVIYETAVSMQDFFNNDLQGIRTGPSLEEKRLAFNSFSQNLYNLLRTIKYDRSKIYFQECPMAFNEEESGYWLSRGREIRNPYLGTSHPKYKSGMLACGDTKDSLDYSAP